MINQLHIRNFKCLRDTTIAFEPLTVLIGQNDSGKTSILEAIHYLGATSSRAISEIFHGASSIDRLLWQGQPGGVVSWELEGQDSAGVFNYQLSMLRKGFIARDLLDRGDLLRVERSGGVVATSIGSGWGDAPDQTTLKLAGDDGVEAATTARDAIRSSGVYKLAPRSLRSGAVPTPDAILSETGDNLAAVLDGLISGPDREAVLAMEASLQAALPNLRGFAVRPVLGGSPGEKVIEFALSGGGRRATIPCELASDGAMLITAFLALAYSDTPEVLLIEEPENGLHSARLKEIIDLLRRMTTGEVGNKRRQIILTTHSPLLLNYARPEEVRIVRRDPEQGTQVTPLDKVEGIDGLLEEFGIGELWYLLGEQGLVEGKKP